MVYRVLHRTENMLLLDCADDELGDYSGAADSAPYDSGGLCHL